MKNKKKKRCMKNVYIYRYKYNNIVDEKGCISFLFLMKKQEETNLLSI